MTHRGSAYACFLHQSVAQGCRGTEDWLGIAGRLTSEITPESEQQLGKLPKDVETMFNDYTTLSETLDYHSRPTIFMPDEFEFSFDIERLSRLAREELIYMLPSQFSLWETQHVPIAETWIGRGGEPISRAERGQLYLATRAVWKLPVRGKTFLLGDDQTGIMRRAKEAGLREHGAIVQEQVSSRCDYFVTENDQLGRAAERAGAKKVINRLVLTVMLQSRNL